jgi:hypothetical protein
MRSLVADETEVIMQARSEGRFALVPWRVAWLWIHWIRYLLSGPFDSLLRSARRRRAKD